MEEKVIEVILGDRVEIKSIDKKKIRMKLKKIIKALKVAQGW